MIVLMTTDTVGGVWTYTMELCRSLEASGTTIHLLTMGAAMQADQRRDVDSLQHVTVYETEYALEWMVNPWKDIKRCSDWLLDIEALVKPDIIHLNSFVFGSLPFRAPVVVVAHSDVYSWYDAVKGVAPGNQWKKYFERVRSGIHAADFVIAPSRNMMDMLKATYGVPVRNQVIYNGRTPELFRQAPKERRVLSMGRVWDEAKNISLLMRAAPMISVPVRIAGEISFSGKVITDNHSNVQYLGKLSAHEAVNEFAAAAVYVLPARYEPFGLSILEAAMSGCALVVGNISSLRELWKDAALFIDTEDENELARTVNKLLADSAALALLASRARARASRFTAASMAQHYQQVYTKLSQRKAHTKTETA